MGDKNISSLYFGACYKEAIQAKYRYITGIGSHSYLVSNQGLTFSHHMES